jgi:hypothetical protein
MQNVASLPDFNQTSENSNIVWNEALEQDISTALSSAYMEIVHWKPNLFMVPSGIQGKAFVNELARMFNAFANESALESIAITAAMSMPALLLQKPHVKSKTKDHICCLRRRLELWKHGQITDLLNESRTIQARLQSKVNRKYSDVSVPRLFAKNMMNGKVKTALKMLSSQIKAGVLNLEDTIQQQQHTTTVRQVLKEKHPKPSEICVDAIVPPTESNTALHIIFESINADEIRKSALKTEGSAGPSGADAMCWRRWCTAFGDSSNDLCQALSNVAKRLCTTYVNPKFITAYTACRLIPLDKNPGVRPIGVGEVVRRIIGKTIMMITKSDLQESVGQSQLCAGFEAGCETAFHTMSHIFSLPETEAALFVDASNAFNSLNRRMTLLNAQSICPILAPVLINTYRESSYLFVDGEYIFSEEGTTQGDPLAMAMYAIGIQPLVQKLEACSPQVWYADDSAAGSSVEQLRQWWDVLQEEGPKYGYYTNSRKTKLLIKENNTETASRFFNDTGITIVTDGVTYLGGAIGKKSFIEDNARTTIEGWMEELCELVAIAETEPHSAYAAYTHGVQSKFNYFFRITDWDSLNLSHLLIPIEEILSSKLIPVLSGHLQPGKSIRELLSLPVRLGGLGIPNPISISGDAFKASQLITAPLLQSVLNGTSATTAQAAQKRAKNDLSKDKHKQQDEQAKLLKQDLTPTLKRCVDLAQEKGASTWLSALPLTSHGFALHKSAFKDALALRYGWPLQNTPSHCACGKAFSVDHALSCSTGGFPTIRHNEVRDLTARLLSEVCHNVTTEPHLQPLTGESMRHRSAITTDNARLDVSMCGFWGGRFEKAFIDVRVFNPSAASNRSSSLTATYKRHEQDKKRDYEQRILEVEHASFTPLVMSCTGGMGSIATTFYKRLAAMISEKRDTPYSQVVHLIRAKLSFALLRSSIMCIRGARSKRQCYISEAGHNLDLQLSEGHFTI